MEETKELQTAYKIFRAVIYVSLLLEFFEYAIDPELLAMFMTESSGGSSIWMVILSGVRLQHS